MDLWRYQERICITGTRLEFQWLDDDFNVVHSKVFLQGEDGSWYPVWADEVGLTCRL